MTSKFLIALFLLVALAYTQGPPKHRIHSRGELSGFEEITGDRLIELKRNVHFQHAETTAIVRWKESAKENLGDLVKVEVKEVEGAYYRLTFASENPDYSEVVIDVISKPWEQSYKVVRTEPAIPGANKPSRNIQRN